ncbi:MAG TPA: OmpH family outer membrane protein [Candidatus Angelobacter sp.]|nr:OmpH family outer membrane protein [Candidatus Angelobacter sp.]
MPETTTYNQTIRPLYRFPASCERLTYVATNERANGLKESTIPMSGKSKFNVFALSLGLSIILSAVAVAQAAGPAASGAAAGANNAAPATGAVVNSGKIGIVNIQDAIIATNEGKKEFDALQARFAPKQNELKTLNDEVENLKKDLQAKSDKLNEEERNKQVKALEGKQKTLQRNYDDAQTEFQQAEQEVVNRIGGKMLNVLEKYARTNNYAVILDVSNPQTPVLWASQGTNITKELVDAYNAESPVTPAAPAPKPAGAAATRPPAGGATTPKKP